MKNTRFFNIIPALFYDNDTNVPFLSPPFGYCRNSFNLNSTFTLNLLRGLHTNKNKNSSSDITPIVSFDNTDTQKVEIFKEIKGKVGIYRWVQKNLNKSYIGGSSNLTRRLANYYNYNYLVDPKRNMTIHKALLKYGYSEFRLDILEYCSKEEVLAREQYYLDLLSPEYNILKTAGSSQGYKHTSETIEKFKERAKSKIYSIEEKARASKLHTYRSEESKIMDVVRILEINKAKGQRIEVLNTLTNEMTYFDSIRQAAEKLGCAHVSILRILKNKNLLKGIYKINHINK